MSFPVSEAVGIFTQVFKANASIEAYFETPLEQHVRVEIEHKITPQLWRIATDTWGGLRDQGYREWEGQR